MKPNLWDKYGKSIVAAAFAVYSVFVGLWSGDKHIDPAEGIIIALAVGNSLIVYIVPLTKSFSGVKSVVNALMAGLVVAQTQIAGGIDANDVMLIVGAIVATLGVVVAPAYSPKEHVMVGLGSDKAIAV
jgi:uncharacterized membrane protein